MPRIPKIPKLFRRNRPKPPRRRRSPELARTELLDAAERVFAELQPDQVGLKEIAEDAGVSHALITHYFGTYAGLIEAVFERRNRVLRDKIIDGLTMPGALTRAGELLGMLWTALEDPIHVRLMRWLIASERPNASHAFAFQDHGLQQVARRVAATLTTKPSAEMIDRIEITLITAVAAAYGYATSKYALAAAADRPVSRALDHRVRDTLASMVQHQLRAELAALTL